MKRKEQEMTGHGIRARFLVWFGFRKLSLHLVCQKKKKYNGSFLCDLFTVSSFFRDNYLSTSLAVFSLFKLLRPPISHDDDSSIQVLHRLKGIMERFLRARLTPLGGSIVAGIASIFVGLLEQYVHC